MLLRQRVILLLQLPDDNGLSVAVVLEHARARLCVELRPLEFRRADLRLHKSRVYGSILLRQLVYLRLHPRNHGILVNFVHRGNN